MKLWQIAGDFDLSLIRNERTLCSAYVIIVQAQTALRAKYNGLHSGAYMLYESDFRFTGGIRSEICLMIEYKYKF